VEEVEEITGMEIQNYVMIDMYAFIDVIDYLGGIDVTLDSPLIDPTYKTFDEGEWGTLYYSAGIHHLSGVQALRIARSRHYSSDFDRAKRQHKILYGIREKGKSLSIKDAGKLLQIAVTLLNKTDTDISPKEGLNYFLKYKNYTIAGQNVLSSGNVLTSTYSNIYNGTVSANCSECYKGAYILTPKNNDWRLVRSYIYNILRN
jgi:anionic cell wall polymer biosynthesis LytR-Cps2A-Psr (LCP) family protein